MNRCVCFILICFSTITVALATPLHTAIDSGNVILAETLLKSEPELLNSVNENGESPLCYAAKTQQAEMARFLIAQHADISQPDREGALPIHRAAKHGSLPIIKMLVEAGVDPRTTDDGVSGGTAIHWAADGGNTDILDYLITLGLDIQNPDRGTFTPLMRAASRGHKTAFDLLVARGAHLDIGTDGNNSVFAQAAGGGNIALVDDLLAKGFDINARSSNLSAPIHVAVWRQQHAMVKHLMDKGARTDGIRNRFGAPMIYSAGAVGDTAMASILLAHGAILDDSCTDNGATALHMAASAGQIPMMQYLLDRGANIDRVDRWGSTPLGWAAEANQLEAAEFLIRHGATLDPAACPERFACAERLASPLHRAATRSPEMVRLLLDHGVDPNSRDSDGTTPLTNSTWSDSIRCMQILLENGADPDMGNRDGFTPLFRTCQMGKFTQAKMLLDHGADPNIVNVDGLTPLHAAVIAGYDSLVRELISAGADLNRKDALKRRPLYYADYHGHPGIADFLRARGAKGGLKSSKSDRELLSLPLNMHEAVVWYLSHSGWAIKTKNHLLIIDYFPPEQPSDDAALVNGYVSPEAFDGMNVAVFASHEHNDHCDPSVLQWQRHHPEIRYFLGVRPEQIRGYRPDPAQELRYTLCQPGEIVSDGGIEIQSMKSDIDQGVGFLIRVDGMTIFHSGDAVDTSRAKPSRYSQTIDSLANVVGAVDLFFFPVRGCGFPDLDAVKSGCDYTIQTMKPKVALPMHARNSEQELREYVRDAKQRGAKANYYTVRQRGDRFLYKNGKAQTL